ncbi:DUF441 family protein, partial [Enterococcus faecium]|uniref:DUF441 family protein n=1 Tax=Enterococcus faecium TaxID=1352 RepID=UPI00292E63C3
MGQQLILSSFLSQSLMIAAAFVLIMKLIPASRSFFPWLQGKGINIGVTIITAAI